MNKSKKKSRFTEGSGMIEVGDGLEPPYTVLRTVT